MYKSSVPHLYQLYGIEYNNTYVKESLWTRKICTILKTLAEENNITYAARRLFMTQPALSERIKKLEKEFNCPIINRQARGVEFTYQGQRLVRYAEDFAQFLYFGAPRAISYG